MVSGERHKVGLDYLVNARAEVDLSFFGQTMPAKDFTDRDKGLFSRRLPIVKTSQGTYGLVANVVEYDKSGALLSFHFTYEEGYKDEKLVGGKWEDA